MRLGSRGRALARAAGAGALAAGCALTAVGAAAGQADAATAKPPRVSGFAVKNGSVTTHGATLTWNKDARATTYRVVIAYASTPTAGAAYDSGYHLTGTSVTVNNLAPGTAFEAKISPRDAAGPSGWTHWVFFYTTGAQGPQGKQGPQGPSGVLSTRTYPLAADPAGNTDSIHTGGSFATYAHEVGTASLASGTYLLNVNFMATPNAATTGAVFPQAFVYNGAAKPDFSNDLFNVGSGALSPYNAKSATDQVNSYYSGSTVVVVPKGGETLHVYAFGYDSDQGGGSYELNSLSLTATALNVAG